MANTALRFALRPAFAVPRVADRGIVIRLFVGYAVVFAAGVGLTWGLSDRSPLVHPHPWLALSPLLAGSLSVALGVAAAFVLAIATRAAVGRFGPARQLHTDLRPLARSLTPAQIVGVASAASLAEETFFRGFLVPLCGVAIAAILFGIAHQVRGPSRWVWVGWSTVGGLVFGAIYAGTGSLVGALVGHALVNAANLAFLREHDAETTCPTIPAPRAAEKAA